MTPEQKAKAYDEALEKAKQIIVEYNYDEHNNVFMEIFPELKESEDEKIRKEIMEYVKNTPAAPEGHIEQQVLSRWIAWIEKQGEPTDINPSEFDLRLNKLLKQFETLPKEELASCLSFYLNVVQNDGTYKPDEKQGEQKPVDKVEPKFKVRDCVTDGILVCEIESIDETCYYCDYTNFDIKDQDKWKLVEQDEQKPADREFTFKAIPRLLEMIEPTNLATAYCQKLIGALVREGYTTDAKIVGECLKKMNGEDVPMAVMDEQKATNDTDEDIVEV